MRRLVGVLLTLLLCPLIAAPASAATPQAPLADVLKTLNVESRPTDYVILVDTSGSMTTDGRYAKVKTALASMLRALQPTDRVALITFDQTAAVRFNAPVGGRPLAALDTLPAAPTGKYTDIGAGIDAGLKVLEAADAKPLGAIALVTDGLVDAPGSPYATPGSPAWAELRRRADAVSGRHEIAAYALGLVSQTDAALLHQPFPKAVDIPADQISARLSSLQRELLVYQAAERVRPDLERSVSVEWSGIDWARLPAAGGDLRASLTLASPFEQVPVTVTGLTATASDGLSVAFDSPPGSIPLTPGATVDVPVTVHVPARAGRPNVAVTGSVESPWSDVLTKNLGLAFAPKLASSVDAVVPERPAPPIPMPNLLLYAGVTATLLVVALSAVLVVRLARPRMVGSLSIQRDGVVIREFLLDGRSAKLDDPATPGLTGRVEAVRPRADTGPGVMLVPGTRAAWKRTVLRDGESLHAGSQVVTYTAQHSRILSMINSRVGD